MRRYYVAVTENASRDLDDIVDYIAQHDGPAKAAYVLDRISSVIERLSTLAETGPYPPELLGLGIREFREAFFKPYRLIYRVIGNTVYIDLIADGRRDMPSLLARRLLGN
jgi:toxin ParE1/3/4